jgi:hypothetical protein
MRWGDITVAMLRISTGAVIAIAVLGIALTLTTAGLLSVTQLVSSSGTITTVNVGVYSDSACTQNLTSINWGTVSPGGSVTKTIYVKNTGSVQITLSMTETNWSPTSANGPITITWNKEGTTLTAGATATATLTLSVSSGISGITTFSVNIVIAGSG